MTKPKRPVNPQRGSGSAVLRRIETRLDAAMTLSAI